MYAITKELVNVGSTLSFKNQNLTPRHKYHVIEINDGFIRVVNDLLDPVLYPTDLFDIVELVIPADWVKVTYDGETFHLPMAFSHQYFFEDYFDRNIKNIRIYDEYLYLHFKLKRLSFF